MAAPPQPAYESLRRLLFRLDPETAHDTALRGLGAAERLEPILRRWRRRLAYGDARLACERLGLRFPNPVGLAAGFDKDARAVGALAALGFGSIEVGTVTPRSQPGNPRPRLFRLTEHRSLRNAMGFNNAGAEALARRLERYRDVGIPVGVNLGRNKDTPADRGEEDYLALLDRLGALGDYFVLNVSSPNTPGLRQMEEGERLARLVRRARRATTRPLLVKLSPDLADELALEIAERVVTAGAAGLILTNTTVDYSLAPGVERAGGLSGELLALRSRELLRTVAERLHGRCLLVSVGGIASGEEAYRRLRSGAGLVQLYTGLVYGGPGLPGRINRELAGLLERDGFASVDDAIGADLASASELRPGADLSGVAP